MSDRLLLATICLAPLVGFLMAIALSPFFPVVADELGTTVALLGQIPALSMLGAAVLGLVIGPLADHYGNRPLLIAGAIAVAACALGTALALSFAVLVVAAVFGAVGRASLQPVSLAIATIHFKGDTRRRATSMVVASVSGAAIVGVPAMTGLAAILGWRAAFVALTVLALGAAALAVWTLPRDVARGNGRLKLTAILSAYAPLVRHRPTLGLFGSSLLRNAGTWCFFTYFGAFLVQQHHLSVQEAGWGYTAVGLGFFIGSMVASGRLGRLPPRPMIVAANTLLGLAIIGSLLLPIGAVGTMALIHVGAIFAGLGNVAVTMLLAIESPGGRATTMTLNQSAFSLGIAVGSAIGGLLLTLGGYPAIALGVAVFCFSGAVLVWLWRPQPAVVATI